ncbi:hypothetical protein Tco_0798766 [Tanacetum coccineum]
MSSCCWYLGFKCGQAGHLPGGTCKKNTGASSLVMLTEARRIKAGVFALTQDQPPYFSLLMFTMTPILLDHVLCISTPMKDSARITHVYRDLPLQFDDKIRSVNALPLDICEFLTNSGIDWLAHTVL